MAHIELVDNLGEEQASNKLCLTSLVCFVITGDAPEPYPRSLVGSLPPETNLRRQTMLLILGKGQMIGVSHSKLSQKQF